MPLAEKAILIVEDEPDTAEMLAEMMRLSGYEVHKTLSGSAALSMMHRYKPDAVLLDIMMPECSGLEVLHNLQRDPRLMNTPVVVVSALAMPEQVQLGLDSGAAVYLTKPVGYKELKQAVARVLEPGFR